MAPSFMARTASSTVPNAVSMITSTSGDDGLRLFQELETGEAGHLEVGENAGRRRPAQPVERGLPVGSQHHSVALAGQRPLETLAHRGIVVRHQQRGLVSHPGSS